MAAANAKGETSKLGSRCSRSGCIAARLLKKLPALRGARVISFSATHQMAWPVLSGFRLRIQGKLMWQSFHVEGKSLSPRRTSQGVLAVRELPKRL
jgi:hypothetical protein